MKERGVIIAGRRSEVLIGVFYSLSLPRLCFSPVFFGSFSTASGWAVTAGLYQGGSD